MVASAASRAAEAARSSAVSSESSFLRMQGGESRSKRVDHGLVAQDGFTEIYDAGQSLVEALAKLLQGEFGFPFAWPGGLKKERAVRAGHLPRRLAR